jgi:hypothetical protein
MTVTNELKALRKLMPPPSRPVEAVGNWQAIEKKLGTSLPEDYKQFVKTYGCGKVGNFIRIFNPFASSKHVNLLKQCAWILPYYRKLENTSPKINPYPIFPAPGGILPWGCSDDADEFFWRTTGEPDQWSIVVHDRSTCESVAFERIGLVSFLTKLVARRLRKFSLPEFVSTKPARFVSVRARRKRR